MDPEMNKYASGIIMAGLGQGLIKRSSKTISDATAMPAEFIL